MKKDLTRGSITAALCSFAAPMILGNLLQQAYNLGDTLVVGRCLGDNALADVMSLSLLMIGATAVIIELAALAFRPQILRLLKTPAEIMSLTSDYVRIILIGICFIFLYNYYSFMLCGLGDSVTPLVFLGISSAVNILLDILFVAKFSMGIKGAAWATLISQALAGAGLAVFSLVRESSLRPQFCRRLLSRSLFGEVTRMSSAACVQQSVMNFGILMI
jgi:Na+-driven multidrug efflux pump